MTHGQLKEVARHFFDRLQAELYYPTGQSYPWDAPVAQPVADYAVANLGQIKSLFQFDLATDSDKDGLPDWWEKAHGLNHKNRNDALATSAGGRMTNLAAYRNHLDPADASAPVASSLAPSDPPIVITLRSRRLDNSTADSSSAFIDIDPGSPPLIKNGDFEEDEPNPPSPPSSGEFIGDLRKWHVGEPSPAKLAWRAIGGEKAVSPTDPNIPGERANYLQWETQQQIADYTLPSRYGSAKIGKLNSYAELDAHWERKDANGTPIRGNTATDKKDAGKSDPSTESDHGIKQTVSLSRGNYLLLFDYRGRVGSDSNQFKVSAKGERAVDLETDLIAEKDASDPITGESPTGLQKWKQGSVSFSVSGGNPADTAALPVILKFDLVLAAGKKADSFGVFIDNVILLPVDIKEVISDQVSGNDCNKLPTAYFGGEPNNPMLMATRTGKHAHLAIKIDTTEALRDKVFVEIREKGGQTIFGSVAAKPPTEKTLLDCDVLDGHKLYEIVAGYEQNNNGKLDNDEAQITFEKTPKKKADGSPATANLEYLDKIRIVTEADFIAAKAAVIGYNGIGTGYAGDLVGAFGKGSSTIPNATTTNPIVISAHEPGLSHPVGGRWTNNCFDTTYRFTFPDGSPASNDFEASNALGQIVDKIVNDNLAALIAAYDGSVEWPVSGYFNFSESKDLLRTEAVTIGVNKLGYAFGKVTTTGTLRVSYKKTGANTITVGGIEAIGSFDDLYDFIYNGTNEKVRNGAMTQAGHATLTNNVIEHDSGKVFFTQLQFNTNWKNWNRNY